jgi:hypothetical protein
MCYDCNDSGLYYKRAKIVNDSSLYYKRATIVMTVACTINERVVNYASSSVALAPPSPSPSPLPLARSVNYDRKVHCKLKLTFTLVNFGHNMSIAHATGMG